MSSTPPDHHSAFVTALLDCDREAAQDTPSPIHGFLGEPTDTRSSDYLEDAATEFQVQGLEVDWACVTWDADLRLVDGAWLYHSFRGDVWTSVKKSDRQRYLLNAYRVLLTPARQGMAIFVPPGDRRDPTRLPKFYDGTFEYLCALGLSLAWVRCSLTITRDPCKLEA